MLSLTCCVVFFILKCRVLLKLFLFTNLMRVLSHILLGEMVLRLCAALHHPEARAVPDAVPGNLRYEETVAQYPDCYVCQLTEGMLHCQLVSYIEFRSQPGSQFPSLMTGFRGRLSPQDSDLDFSSAMVPLPAFHHSLPGHSKSF